MHLVSTFLLAWLFPCFLLATTPPGEGDKSKHSKEVSPDKDRPKPQVALEGEIVLTAGFEVAYLKTANGCGISNFVMTCAGDSTLSLSPEIWAIASETGGTYLSNTIPAKTVLGVAFRRESFSANTSVMQTFDPQAPYVVITERGFFSYAVPNDFLLQYPWRIQLTDSLLIPGVKMASHQVTTLESNPVVLCVADSSGGYRLRFYQYPGLADLHSSNLAFMPGLMEVTSDGLFVAGTDTSGQQRLLHFSLTQDSLLGDFLLNDSASMPRAFLSIGGVHYLLSSPGDSMTVLTAVNNSTGFFTQNVILPLSGLRAPNNEVQNTPTFTFQPVSDLPNSFLQRQILLLNPVSPALDTMIVDRELDYFKYPETVPVGFGRFDLEWIGGKWTATAIDSVFIPHWSVVMELPTGARPSFVDASFGCWGPIEEEIDGNVLFTYAPNPAASSVTIHLTGLTKGKPYVVEVLDQGGRVVSRFEVEAYQKIELPLGGLPSGVYHLCLDTGQKRISKKLVLLPQR